MTTSMTSFSDPVYDMMSQVWTPKVLLFLSMLRTCWCCRCQLPKAVSFLDVELAALFCLLLSSLLPYESA